VARRLAQCPRDASRDPTGPVEPSVDRHDGLSIVPCPLRPLWAGRDAKIGRPRMAKGPKPRSALSAASTLVRGALIAEGRQSMSPLSGPTLRGRVAAPMAASLGYGPLAVPRICGEAFGPIHTPYITRSYRAVGPSVDRYVSIAAPRWPFATLAARSTLAIPTCPRGRRGQGAVGQRLRWCLPSPPQSAPRGRGCQSGGLPSARVSSASFYALPRLTVSARCAQCLCRSRAARRGRTCHPTRPKHLWPKHQGGPLTRRKAGGCRKEGPLREII
jgi:hypothetical protein